jgi:hypothetical protein
MEAETGSTLHALAAGGSEAVLVMMGSLLDWLGQILTGHRSKSGCWHHSLGDRGRSAIETLGVAST